MRKEVTFSALLNNTFDHICIRYTGKIKEEIMPRKKRCTVPHANCVFHPARGNRKHGCEHIHCGSRRLRWTCRAFPRVACRLLAPPEILACATCAVPCSLRLPSGRATSGDPLPPQISGRAPLTPYRRPIGLVPARTNNSVPKNRSVGMNYCRQQSPHDARSQYETGPRRKVI